MESETPRQTDRDRETRNEERKNSTRIKRTCLNSRTSKISLQVRMICLGLLKRTRPTTDPCIVCPVLISRATV